MSNFNHFDQDGNAIMVDISRKEITERVAVASCDVLVREETMALILKGNIKKGDVLSVARLAGILGAKKTPDLILLDVMLPDINGLELLKTFRADHDKEDLPIIMVSAFNDVDSTAKCIKLGASDYLPKPLNGTILMAKSVASL